MVNDLATLLMGEVISTELGTLMDTRYYLAVLVSLRGILGQFTMLALHFGKSLFFFPEEAGIGNLFSIGESSKRFQPYVNTDLFRSLRQSLRLALTREAHIPFAGRGTMHGTGFDLTLDRTMIDHLDAANLGKGHTVIMGNAEARLWEGETIVSALALKPRKPSRVRSFSDTPEKSFESQINPNGDVLQDLGMDMLQGKTFLFQHREGLNLSVAGQAFTSLLISLFTPAQQMIIEPTALFKSLVEFVKLFLVGVDAILKHFMHTYIVAHNGQEVKRKAVLYLSPDRNPLPQTRNASSIPVAEARGFTTRFDKKGLQQFRTFPPQATRPGSEESRSRKRR